MLPCNIIEVGKHIELGIMTLRKLREQQQDSDGKSLLIKVEIALRQLKQEFTQYDDLVLLSKIVSSINKCPSTLEMVTKISDIIDSETNQNKVKLSILSESCTEVNKLSNIIRSLREQKIIIEERQIIQDKLHKLIYVIAVLVCILWVLCQRFL